MIEPTMQAIVWYVICGVVFAVVLIKGIDILPKDVQAEQPNPYAEELRRKQKLRLKAHPLRNPERSGFDWLADEVWD